MPEENFLLVSLKEDEAKRLAQVISNDTSRHILDFLATRKDATETEIAKHMQLPLSTVHYNLHALLQAKLVQADEFHYSQKGKEVNHYSLANKYVIIAPKETPDTLRSKLRRILPVALVSAVAAALVQFFVKIPSQMVATPPTPEEMPLLAEKAADAAGLAEQVVQVPVAQPLWLTNVALWFLYGALFAVLVFVVVDWISRKK